MPEYERETEYPPPPIQKENPSPVFTPEDLPGFGLTQSLLVLWDGETFLDETWVDSETRAWVQIIVTPCENKSAALARAADSYAATLEKDQYTAVGKPTPGSYTGTPIGHYCWAFTESSRPNQSRTSFSLIVIQDGYLFDLKYLANSAPPDPSIVENLAKRAARRLRKGPPPAQIFQ